MAGFDQPVRGRRPQPSQGGGVRAAAARVEGWRERIPSTKSTKRRNILWRFRRVLFLFALIMMAGVVGAAAFVSRLELTDPHEMLQTSYICAADVEPGKCTADNAMARLSNEDADDRVLVPLEEIPDVLKNAVIATEDRDFYEHKGVSPQAIFRAIFQDLRGGATQGGSTITQQYVKNAYLTSEQTYDRKVREAVLSMKLEQTMSKDDILEAYLNTIFWGRKSFGAQAASRVYFDKDVQDLELAEAALLAGIIRAPVTADPHEHPEEAKRRREVTLEAMLDEGYITEDEYREANADEFESVIEYDGPQQIRTFNRGEGIGSEYVTAFIQEELQKLGYSDEQITGGGLRVYTTLDLDLQEAAYNTVYGPEGVLNQEGDPAAALVTLDDQGHIVAMVGGKDFRADNDYAQLNLAENPTGRPVGSTFKPVAVAAAVQAEYSLANSTYNSPSPYTVDQSGISGCAEEWEVNNYDETTHEGRLNVLKATEVSSNTAFAQMMVDLTPTRVKEMAEALGMDTDSRWTDDLCPPVVLGTENSTPLEMAEVYSTFANGGMRNDPTIVTRVEIVDTNGEARVDWEWQEDTGQRVMPEERANLVTHALRGVVEGGTGTAAQLGTVQVAGKTGTTSDNKDAWFVGYVPPPGLTTAVWMGYVEADWKDETCDPNDPEEPRPERCGEYEIPPMNENGRPVRGGAVTGGGLPAQIWQKYMTRAVATRGMPEGAEFPEVTEEQLRDGRTLPGSQPAQPSQPDRGDRDRGRDRDRDRDRDREITLPTEPTDPGPTSPTIIDWCDINPNRPECQNDPDPGDTTTSSTEPGGGGGPGNGGGGGGGGGDDDGGGGFPLFPP